MTAQITSPSTSQTAQTIEFFPITNEDISLETVRKIFEQNLSLYSELEPKFLSRIAVGTSQMEDIDRQIKGFREAVEVKVLSAEVVSQVEETIRMLQGLKESLEENLHHLEQVHTRVEKIKEISSRLGTSWLQEAYPEPCEDLDAFYLSLIRDNRRFTSLQNLLDNF